MNWTPVVRVQAARLLFLVAGGPVGTGGDILHLGWASLGSDCAL